MYSIENLKKLRDLTGVSFSLCKKALDESADDIAKAQKLLEKWGIEKAESKLLRPTKQGSVFSYIHHNRRVGVLLELLCETDFVAQNTEFKKLGAELSMQTASMGPKDQKELLKQAYIKDPKKTIESMIKEYILKIGENITIGRFSRFEI